MTRYHLLEAAAIVFARDGFHGSTLDDVATTAGFSKGAVYSNFKNKEDLFVQLLDDRIEGQFAVVAEILEGGSPDAADQLPRIRDLVRDGTFISDDSWTALYLEFVLYSRRNPEARAKLAASARRSRELVQKLIEAEYPTVGVSSKYSMGDLAEILLALFGGLGIDRLIDPLSVTEHTLDTTLTWIYNALGIDEPPEPAAQSHERDAALGESTVADEH